MQDNYIKPTHMSFLFFVHLFIVRKFRCLRVVEHQVCIIEQVHKNSFHQQLSVPIRTRAKRGFNHVTKDYVSYERRSNSLLEDAFQCL